MSSHRDSAKRTQEVGLQPTGNIFDEDSPDLPAIDGAHYTQQLSKPMSALPSFKKKRTAQPLPDSSSDSALAGEASTTIGKGAVGDRLVLTANFFALTFQERAFYHYYVLVRFPNGQYGDDSRAEKVMKLFGQEVIKAFYNDNRDQLFRNIGYVSDGQRSLYTNSPLSCNDDQEFEVHFVAEGRKRNVMLKIKYAQHFETEPLKKFFDSKGDVGSFDERLVTVYDLLFNKVFGQDSITYQRKHFPKSSECDNRGDIDNRGRGDFDNRGRGDFDNRGRGDFDNRGRGGFNNRGRGGFNNRDRGDYDYRGRGDFDNRGGDCFNNRGPGGFNNRGRGDFDNRGRGGFNKRGQDNRQGGSGFNNQNNGPFDYVGGFVDSVRPIEDTLALNIHLTTAVSISNQHTKLVEFVINFLDIRDGLGNHEFTRKDCDKVSKIIKGLKVSTTYGNTKRIYTVKAMENITPQRLMFDYAADRSKPEEVRRISVADYQLEVYKNQVLPLPMLCVNGQGRSNVVYLPLEFCVLSGNQFLSKSKIDPQMQAAQLRHATGPAKQYIGKVEKFAINAARDVNSLGEFGVTITPKAVVLNGRKLPEPQLSGNARSDKKFHSLPRQTVNYAVFLFTSRVNQQVVNKIERGLRDAAGRGYPEMRLNNMDKMNPPRKFQDINNLMKNAKRKNLQLLIIGIPERDYIIEPDVLYNAIKHFGDQVHGIMTQCFDLSKIDRAGSAYFDNIFLKVNSKLDGQNTVVTNMSIGKALPSNINASRIMVVGADVNHPADDGEASVAAVVGSFDSTLSRFISAVRTQSRRRDEIIEKLQEMMASLFDNFKERNGFYPDHLLIFRDGVSEGQFKFVLDNEKEQIEKAIEQVIGHQCKITMVVVQKGHNARFVLAREGSAPNNRPTFNVPAGTVVDEKIVELGYPTFYLNSHFSPLGVSKPSKYVVLLDQNNFTADQLQLLCYYLCFSCARTRNSISLPVALNYADLLAYRAKGWIKARVAILREVNGGCGSGNQDQIIAQYGDEVVEPNQAVVRKQYYV